MNAESRTVRERFSVRQGTAPHCPKEKWYVFDGDKHVTIGFATEDEAKYRRDRIAEIYEYYDWQP